MSCITKNKNVTSGKIFALDERPSVRLLMQIKNNTVGNKEVNKGD